MSSVVSLNALWVSLVKQTIPFYCRFLSARYPSWYFSVCSIKVHILNVQGIILEESSLTWWFNSAKIAIILISWSQHLMVLVSDYGLFNWLHWGVLTLLLHYFILLADHYPPIEQIVGQCGKFCLLERLLSELFARKHKVCASLCFLCAHLAETSLLILLVFCTGSDILSVD